jgi:hypothetical protein
MRQIRLIVIAAVGLSVAGCPLPPFDGLSRTASLKSMPSVDCVGRIIESTPDTVSVTHKKTEWEENGLNPVIHTLHTFVYRGAERSHINGTLHISAKRRDIRLNEGLYVSGRDSDVVLYQTSHGGASQEDIDATRPVMQNIEHALASECGMASLAANVEEKCGDFQCVP